jgi:D-alanine transaminase
VGASARQRVAAVLSVAAIPGPTVYLGGSFLPLDEARVPVMDRGFLFGDGVYEVIPCYGGHFLRLEQHLDRLDDSLSGIRLENPLGRDAWHAILTRLVGAQPAPDQAVYLQVTRGVAPVREHLCPAGVAPTVFAMATPIKPRGPEVAARGVRCITRPDIRWQRCQIKAISLVANVMMRREAEDEGAVEAILVRDGLVTEAAAANCFLVKGAEVVTPPCGHLILPGITRDLVIELARQAGMRLIERRIPLEELVSADEVWITSSIREVLPVTWLDGAPVGSGVPGPQWARLDALYQEYKERVRGGHV